MQRDLVQVLTNGTPGSVTVIESHLAETKIDGDMLIPIYKIPIGQLDQKEEEESDGDSSFRTMVRVVESRLCENMAPLEKSR